MKQTTNLQLPTYESNDLPNLLDGYNVAMAIIDTAVKANSDAIAAIPTPETLVYKKITVGDLATGVMFAYKETE